jgi:hypothetical protein
MSYSYNDKEEIIETVNMNIIPFHGYESEDDKNKE